MSARAKLVQLLLEPLHNSQRLFVSLSNLLLFGFEFPHFGGVRIVDHGVDLVSDGLLTGPSLTKRLVDRLLHEPATLHFSGEAFDFGRALNTATEGDVHLSF